MLFIYKFEFLEAYIVMKRFSFVIAVLIVFLPVFSGAQEVIQREETLTLERAINIALKNQPAVLAGRSNIDIFSARRGQARSGYFPAIDAVAGYRRFQPAIDTSGSGRGFTGSGTYDQYLTSITANQMIFDFRRTGTQVNIENLNIDTAKEDLRSIEDQVIFNAKQAYFNVLRAQRNLDVAGETVRQFQQHLERARAFFEVGTRPKFDVTRAEVDLGNAQLNRIRAENNLRIARVTLNNTLGVPEAPEYRIEDILSFERYSIDPAEAVNRAYENRPELRAINFRKKAFGESVNLARKGYFPVLSGNAAYTWAGKQFPDGDGWSAGLNLSIPVFSGFSTRYQIAEARANLFVLSANEEELRQSVLLDVQQSYLNLLEADERIAVAELTVRQAEENFEIAHGRYAAGVGNPIEVTDADVALSNARTAFNEALYDYKVARASIEKAMGVR
jgi:outer membrane protein